MLHVFSGRPRVGGFDDCGAAVGVTVTSIDLLLGGRWHDVTDRKVRDALLCQVRLRLWEVVWIGLPCASGTVHWTGASKRPRERHEPDGASGLPQWLQRYVALHNVFLEFTEALGRAAFEAGATFIVENPPDYGDPSSPYFRWSARHHCPLWLSSAMVRLRTSTTASMFTGCQCMLGGAFKKPTTLMTAGPRAMRLRSFSELRCTHSTHSRVAAGWRADGSANSADAAAYPVAMCLWAMSALFADEGAAHASGFAELPESIRASATATLQRTANQAAALRFAAEFSEARAPSPDGDHERDQSTSALTLLRCGEWRSAPLAMPAHWPERADATSARVTASLSAALPYLSRRRCEAEQQEVLARRQFSRPHVAPATSAVGRPPVPWPADAPKRPIHISQLYLPGIYQEIMEAVHRISRDVQSGLPLTDGGEFRQIPKGSTFVWKAEECQPEWARECTWDCSDPRDCIPLQPFSASDPPAQEAAAEFFTSWGRFLRHPDEDMLYQVTVTGVESRSGMPRDTSVMGHHAGLRNAPGPAFARIAEDEAKGWLTPARRDLWTVPARCVPKNIIRSLKWRILGGKLVKKLKTRVSTDDSIRPDGKGGATEARNATIDRDGWGGAELPGPRTLMEAVAIVKSTAAEMGVHFDPAATERVALWAIDLSDAYRALAVARSEWWQQSFVWHGGVQLDLRCVFGSAHLVDFFQRVSLFVLRVATHRIHEYDRLHPYGAGRASWLAWRQRTLGNALDGDTQRASFQTIYIDDGSGLTPLEDDEPVAGARPGDPRPTKVFLGVDPGPDGAGARARLIIFHGKSRAEVHLGLVEVTFKDAGWQAAEDKKQLGEEIDLLGHAIDTTGVGRAHVQEAKRRGMRADIQRQREAQRGLVPFAEVEELTGRCSFLAQVINEGKSYLQPMYKLKNQSWRIVDKITRDVRRVRPGLLDISGNGPVQQAYREALDWWDAVMQEDTSTPLSPRVVFPRPGEEGCVFMFTDAAREAGTGFGGHATVTVDGVPFFLFDESRWEPSVLTALQRSELSMPAGECIGAVAFADALLSLLGGATHLIVFSDSDATAKAFSTASSGAPQLNVAMRWLIARHPSVQFVGIHQPGARNGAADGLSRQRSDRARVLAEVAAAGLAALRIVGDRDAVSQLIAAVRAQPLRR
jgi:hypothetical protein